MIRITAHTLAQAMFSAAPFARKGATVTRCIKTPGPGGRWEVCMAWPATHVVGAA
jgi:uncharacterized protein YndB with AHSA1/START domain